MTGYRFGIVAAALFSLFVLNSAAAAKLADNNNGTVTDSQTGLDWQQREVGFKNWANALTYCEELRLGEADDWRLPNIKELESLTDDTRYNPSIDTTFFPDAFVSYYWSSTTAGNSGRAWYVYFGSGAVGGDGSKDNTLYVRCVRGGQSGLSGSLSISPAAPDFGKVAPGNSTDLTLTLRNSGTSSLTLGPLSIPVGSGFSIALDSCSNATLAANAICSVMVRFAPTTVQAYTGALTIPNGASIGTVALKGVGWSGGSPAAYLTLSQTQGGAPTNSSYVGSTNGDNDFAGLSEIGYAISGEDASIVSHALYPVEYYTQKSTDRSGFLSLRDNVSEPDSTDTRQPLILIHGWQGDSSVTSGFIDRDQRWLLEDNQLGENYWNNFIRYFNKTPALNQRYRLYVYHYPSYKHVSLNARLLAKLIPRVGYINNWLAGGKKITILAHSMGGLVSRSLIEEHNGVTVKKGDGSTVAVSGLNMLDRLVTSATPHHGSPASVYWWLKKEGYTSQLADFKKDLFSPGAQDLFWDNYDGIFDWVVGSGFNYSESGADVNRIDNENSGRRSENAAFDSYYRTKLHLLDSKANDAYTGKLSLNNTPATVYRYPNPWLSWLNARFKQNKALYASKYVFFGGYNDGKNADNRLRDSLIADMVADERVYEMGYINDWAVPLTSAFLDFGKESTGALYSYNGKLFSDSGGKSALFPSWLTDHTKVELNSSVNGIPTRALKDYHHDRLLNGAYYNSPSDLLDHSVPSGFSTDSAMKSYLEQSGVSYAAYQASAGNPAKQADAKLVYEPLFNLFSQNLPGVATALFFVSTDVGVGGAISPATGLSVSLGQTASFAISPATDYLIDSVSGCNGTLKGTTYTTAAVTADCTVTATFKLNGASCIRQMGNIVIRSTSCSSTTAYNVFNGRITFANSGMPDNPLLKIDNGSLDLDLAMDRIDTPVFASSALYVPAVSGLGNVPLGWSFNFDVKDTTLTIPADSSQIVMDGAEELVDSLLGFKLALNSITLSPNAASIKGQLSSSFLVNKYLTDATDKPLSIAAGLTLSQTTGLKVDSVALSAPEIKFANSTLKNVEISLDTVKQRYSIGAQVSFRNLFNEAGIGGNMTFTGEFPYIDTFSVVGSDINKPLGHPLVFLQKVEGSISGIVEPPFKATLKASFSGGPQLPASLAGFKALCANDFGLELDASSYLAGTGILGALCLESWESYKNGAISLNGRLEYNWRKQSYDTEADMVFPYEIFRGKGNLHFGSDISGKAAGTLKMPKGVPWVGGYPMANQTVKFDSKGAMASMAILQGEIVTRMDWSLFTDELSNALSHIDVDINWKEISKSSSKRTLAGAAKSVALAAGPTSVTVPAGLGMAIIRVTWQSGTSDVHLVAPDGTIFTAAYAAEHPDRAFYMKLDSEAWYGINSPAAGQWQVVIVTPNAIGDYTATVNSMNAKPAITVISPATNTVSSGLVDIAYTASDPDNSPTIALYYDTKNSSEAGNRIVGGLPMPAGTGTYRWDVSAIPPGVYYVYAVIDDGVNMPVAAYAQGSVEVTNSSAPAMPAQLAATAAGNTIRVYWSNVIGATGYKLYYTESSAGETYHHAVTLPADAGTYLLNNLKPETTYRLTVISLDRNLQESLMASPVTATTSAVPTPIITTSTAQADFGTIRVGQAGSVSISVTNSGTADLVIATADFSGHNSSMLAIDPGVTFPVTIAPGGSAHIPLNLSATDSGTVNALLLLDSNDPNTPRKSVVLTASAPYENYMVTFVAGSGGSIAGAMSQSVPSSGSAASVLAVPDAGYRFVNWTGTNGFSTTATNPLKVSNVASSQAITANFALNPVNGVCGSANGMTVTTAPTANLCTNGTTSAVSGTGPWTWACSGQYSGTDANCSAAKAKPGDCDGNGAVTISEGQSAINMFLGLKPVAVCVDTNSNGTVAVSEVQKVINNFIGF